MLYGGGVIGGIGAGIVYGTASGAALKWFPDRRGRFTCYPFNVTDGIAAGNQLGGMNV